MENEQRESVSMDPAVPNLPACIRLADHVLLNNGTVEELYEELGKILNF
jgi:dephospho-CoA kinase